MSPNDFAAARANMVNCQVRTTDVTSHPLLEAMFEVPRELFVPAPMRFASYIDEDIEVSPASEDGPARHLMEPSPFAKLVQLADVRAGDTVLDLGCATGYSAAILSKLCESVIAMEPDGSLAGYAMETLSQLGIDNVAVVEGSLREGYPKEAPYDVIVIEGAVAEVPATLLDQLRDGGRLVAIIGESLAGRAHLFSKENGVISSRPAFNAAVPQLAGFERETGFVF